MKKYSVNICQNNLDTIRYDTIESDTIRYDMIRYDLYDMIRHHMI